MAPTSPPLPLAPQRFALHRRRVTRRRRGRRRSPAPRRGGGGGGGAGRGWGGGSGRHGRRGVEAVERGEGLSPSAAAPQNPGRPWLAPVLNFYPVLYSD